MLGHYTKQSLRCDRIFASRSFTTHLSPPCLYSLLYKDHPGGAEIILEYAGRDATPVYEPIHAPDTLEKNLPFSKHMGSLTDSAIQALAQDQQALPKTRDALRVEHARKKMPPLNRILNLQDMEVCKMYLLPYDCLSSAVALRMWLRKYCHIKHLRITLRPRMMKYVGFPSNLSFSSTQLTFPHLANRENARAFSRFFFRARVMRPVSQCNPSTTILGFESSIPVFVSGAALAKLGHPEGKSLFCRSEIHYPKEIGELNITRGSAKEGIIQMVSSNASFSPLDIMQATDNAQTLFFQLYKHKSDRIAENLVREVEKLGYKAIFLTVDALTTGNRERDIRRPWVLEDEENGGPTEFYVEGIAPSEGVDVLGTAGALNSNSDRDMTWEKAGTPCAIGFFSH